MTVRTIKDIAKICNVSTSTVSRALNGESGINKETKARILEVINEYNFVPNSSARNLKKIESNTIALIIPGMKNLLFKDMYGLFESKLHKTEYSFDIHSYGDTGDEVTSAVNLIREKKLKGIIFLGGDFSGYEAKKNLLTVPCVRCAGAELPENCTYEGPSIAIDDEKESYRVTDYLCKKGHKRIAIMTDHKIDKSVAALRLKGYKIALKDNNIEFDPSLVITTDPTIEEFSIENGYKTGKKLLESGIDFTALFATSDSLAFGVYKAFFDAGKRIPDDYSIIGFDGIESSQFYCPALTTLAQPAEAMVNEAIAQLMKQIDGEAVEKRISYEGTLIERDSVKNI